MTAEDRAELVGMLLQRGADPNQGKSLSGTYGHSSASLHKVARGMAGRDLVAEVVVIGMLLDAGADPNGYDVSDKTPLESLIVSATQEGFTDDQLEPIYSLFLS